MLQKINVVCATNNDFAFHCGVMLESLLDNSKKPKNIFIYLLCPSISKPNKTSLLQIVQKYGSNIEFVKIDLSKVILPKKYHLSKDTCSRMLASDLLKDINKFVYLDSDILVLEDISKLYNISLDKYPLGAIKSFNLYSKHLGWAKLKDKDLFNAGILLIDANYFRKNKVSKKLLNMLRMKKTKIKFTQDVLNIFFNGNWKKLSVKWNVQASFFGSEIKNDSNKKEIETAIKNPAIIHFTGSIKPNDYLCIHPYQDKYIEYLRKTPWKDTKLKNKNLKGFFIKQVKKMYAFYLKWFVNY